MGVQCLSLRFTIFLSLSITASTSASSSLFCTLKSSPSSPSIPKATPSDLLSLLGPTSSHSSSINPLVAQELKSCFKFLVPFTPNKQPKIEFCEGFSNRRTLKDKKLNNRNSQREDNELIWWPPVSVLELARLSVDSGGDPDAIFRALDPTMLPVPDVEGSKENRCQITRTPYGRHFISEELNSYLKYLFDLIVARGPSVGLDVSVNRYDLFHGHLFLASETGRLGILFHAREYPAYNKERFPYNMGYCQKGSNVTYDDSMNLRNILWLAPLPSNSTKAWLAPGVLVVLDARPDGIIYRDLIPEYVKFVRTIYEVSKDLNAEEESVILRMVQAVAVPVIGNVCHVFMHGLNRVQVYGLEKLHDALLHRPKNKSLITVSNHVASVDDPFVIASLLPPNVLLDARNLRWTLCATDRCFKNPVTTAFFRSVKVLPVSRGEGIYQKGMDMAISKLNSGGWVHIFPEGSRSRDGGKTIGSPKRGVGRLILDADNVPMVVPFVHTGMQDVMPIGANFPRIGKTVTVLIGDPIEFDGLLNEELTKHLSRGKLYDAVASRIGHRLQRLKLQVDRLAHEQRSAEHVTDILQQVDGESLALQNQVLNEDYSLAQETQVQFKLDITPTQDRSFFRMGLSCGDAFASMRGYVDPTELMGFAARGLYMNRRMTDGAASFREIGPLRAWKQYLEANLLGKWNVLM